MTRIKTVTEDQVFNIFVDEERKVANGSAPVNNSYPAIQRLLDCHQLSDDHIEKLKLAHRRFKTAKAKFQKKGGYKSVLENAPKTALLEVIIEDDEKPMEVEVDEQPPPKKLCRLKGLNELSRKQLKRRTDGLFNDVKKLATKESVSVARILGFLLTCSPESEKIRAVGEAIWNEGQEFNTSTVTTNKTLPAETALLLHTDCKLGRQTWTKMRKVLSNGGFNILPAWIHVRSKQKEITPSSNPLPDPHVGVF